MECLHSHKFVKLFASGCYHLRGNKSASMDGCDSDNPVNYHYNNVRGLPDFATHLSCHFTPLSKLGIRNVQKDWKSIFGRPHQTTFGILLLDLFPWKETYFRFRNFDAY